MNSLKKKKLQNDIQTWKLHLKMFEEYIENGDLRMAKILISDLIEGLEFAEDFLILECDNRRKTK
jgi:hypothetical protein